MRTGGIAVAVASALLLCDAAAEASCPHVERNRSSDPIAVSPAGIGGASAAAVVDGRLVTISAGTKETTIVHAAIYDPCTDRWDRNEFDLGEVWQVPTTVAVSGHSIALIHSIPRLDPAAQPPRDASSAMQFLTSDIRGVLFDLRKGRFHKIRRHRGEWTTERAHAVYGLVVGAGGSIVLLQSTRENRRGALRTRAYVYSAARRRWVAHRRLPAGEWTALGVAKDSLWLRAERNGKNRFLRLWPGGRLRPVRTVPESLRPRTVSSHSAAGMTTRQEYPRLSRDSDPRVASLRGRAGYGIDRTLTAPVAGAAGHEVVFLRYFFSPRDTSCDNVNRPCDPVVRPPVMRTRAWIRRPGGAQRPDDLYPGRRRSTAGTSVLRSDLPEAATRKVVRSLQKRARRCAARNRFAGVLKLQLRLRPDGKLRSLRVDGPSKEARTCVSNAARATRYPRSPRGGRVAVRLVF